VTEHGTDVPDPHLEAHEVVAYLDGKLTAAARGRVETHLSNCDECTAELAAVCRLRPRHGRRVLWLSAGAAAAASIAGLLLLRPGGPREAGGEALSPHRSPAPLTSVPVRKDTLPGPVSLSWPAVPGATAYRVSLRREDGRSVWVARTVDTGVAIPSRATLAAGGRYYWQVEVLPASGRPFSWRCADSAPSGDLALRAGRPESLTVRVRYDFDTIRGGVRCTRFPSR
jgi:hypothetical protein